MYEEMSTKQNGNWDVHRAKEGIVELFTPADIVYLTAESDETLEKLDESKVYVIGGLVDHNSQKGLCERRAKEMGLATARLPIDEFLTLKTRKVLTINHVYEILVSFAQTNDWQAALLKLLKCTSELGYSNAVSIDAGDEVAKVTELAEQSTVSGEGPAASTNAAAAIMSPKLLKKLERRKLRRQEEGKRKQERRKKAREEGNPLPSRKSLKKSGTMAGSSSKQRVAIDCSFDDFMNQTDIQATFKQIAYCYAANRRSPAPFQLYFTSFNSQTAAMYKEMSSKNENGNWDVHRAKEGIVELFTPADIVYITAESDQTLEKLDESKVYVIGGMVDHNARRGQCERRAREMGLATARLPIHHLLTSARGKILPINHVYEILLSFAQTNDWQAALLKVIPQGKETLPK